MIFIQSEFNREKNGEGWKAMKCIWNIFVAHFFAEFSVKAKMLGLKCWHGLSWWRQFLLFRFNLEAGIEIFDTITGLCALLQVDGGLFCLFLIGLVLLLIIWRTFLQVLDVLWKPSDFSGKFSCKTVERDFILEDS